MIVQCSDTLYQKQKDLLQEGNGDLHMAAWRSGCLIPADKS